MAIGVQRLYFHQGTVNSGDHWAPFAYIIKANLPIAYFNWWSDTQINFPFYGAFFAALALKDGDHIIASDLGVDSYAQYIIYKAGKPFKVALINTDYYPGSGNRNSSTYTLTGLKGSKPLKSLRFTAPSSEVYAVPEQTNPALGPTIGGMISLSSQEYSTSLRVFLTLPKQVNIFQMRTVLPSGSKSMRLPSKLEVMLRLV